MILKHLSLFILLLCCSSMVNSGGVPQQGSYFRSRALTTGGGYGGGSAYGGGGYAAPQPAVSYGGNGGYGAAGVLGFSTYGGGLSPTAPVLRIGGDGGTAFPPFCRCYPAQPVCGNDGVSYASICDLVNSMTNLPGTRICFKLCAPRCLIWSERTPMLSDGWLTDWWSFVVSQFFLGHYLFSTASESHAHTVFLEISVLMGFGRKELLRKKYDTVLLFRKIREVDWL